MDRQSYLENKLNLPLTARGLGRLRLSLHSGGLPVEPLKGESSWKSSYISVNEGVRVTMQELGYGAASLWFKSQTHTHTHTHNCTMSGMDL